MIHARGLGVGMPGERYSPVPVSDFMCTGEGVG
jgi:hypothetical protein